MLQEFKRDDGSITALLCTARYCTSENKTEIHSVEASPPVVEGGTSRVWDTVASLASQGRPTSNEVIIRFSFPTQLCFLLIFLLVCCSLACLPTCLLALLPAYLFACLPAACSLSPICMLTGFPAFLIRFTLPSDAIS